MIVEQWRFCVAFFSLSTVLYSQLIHAQNDGEVAAVATALTADGDQGMTANYLYQSQLQNFIISSAPRMKGLTFLAPNDQAWADAPQYLRNNFNSPNNFLPLANLLELHIVKGYYTYADLRVR